MEKRRLGVGISFFHSFKIFDVIFSFSHYYGKQRTLCKSLQSFLLFEGLGYDFSLFINPGRLLPKQ